MTNTEKNDLFQFLHDACKENPDLFVYTLREHFDSLSDNKLDELEDFLVNNFGDD